MGPLGMPEMMFIFVLALVLFGPKKLPEIGRTVGKAITEFRKASSELKSTFEREMKSLEQETDSVKTIVNQYQYDTFNYDYSSQEAPYEGSYGTAGIDSAEVTPDRKSTRLNSSHLVISYAVFCLKKKKINRIINARLDFRLVCTTLFV